MPDDCPSPLLVERLSSGWWHIRWTSECWIQIPSLSLLGDEISDEYIFHNRTNRDRVNRWSTGESSMSDVVRLKR